MVGIVRGMSVSSTSVFIAIAALCLGIIGARSFFTFDLPMKNVTPVNDSRVVTATGILSRHENGYAFVPDREQDIPFPPAPHMGYVVLERDQMLVQTIGEYGRWRATVTLDGFTLTSNSSGDELRGRVVSITHAERIPEEE